MGLDPKAPAVLLNADVDALFRILKDIVANTKRIADVLEQRAAPAAAPPEIDLAAPINDPLVKLEPTKGASKWTGESMKGRRFSECPSDYLDRLALMFDYFAAHPKEGKENFADGERLNAARARAWAKHLRANGAPAAGDAGDDLDRVT